MYHAEILSPWGQRPTGAFAPQVTLDHPFVQDGEYWSEGHGGYGSGQGGTTPPLEPDMCAIYARFTAQHMDDIIANNDYGGGAFLWLEELPEEGMSRAGPTKLREKKRAGVPPANEFGKIRSFLAQHKVGQAQIKEAIGGGVDGRDRAAIAEKLREWLKTLPRAGE